MAKRDWRVTFQIPRVYDRSIQQSHDILGTHPAAWLLRMRNEAVLRSKILVYK